MQRLFLFLFFVKPNNGTHIIILFRSISSHIAPPPLLCYPLQEGLPGSDPGPEDTLPPFVHLRFCSSQETRGECGGIYCGQGQH